jgi:starch phosphorylase
MFYDRGEDGLPAAWIARMRASLKTLAPRFSATRMLSEYLSGPYRGS